MAFCNNSTVINKKDAITVPKINPEENLQNTSSIACSRNENASIS